jgi:hypothetical protein
MPAVSARRWADYKDDEPLPVILFGVVMNPNDSDSETWEIVKPKKKKSSRKYGR